MATAPPKYDHLKVAQDKRVLRALVQNSAGHDKVMWSLKVTKVNRKGKSQQRALVITNRHVLNLDSSLKCKRCIGINMLHHISVCADTQEFALHVSEEYDYRFKTQLYKQAIDVLQEAYTTCTGGTVLQVDDVDSSGLAKQIMTKVSVKQTGSTWQLNPGASTKAADDNEDSDDDDKDAGLGEASSPAGGKTVDAGGAFSAGKSKCSADDFEVLKVLGKGAFGKVMLVKAKQGNGEIYAMKVLSKQLLMERNEVTHTKTERKTLEDTHHPFLVHLRFAFQTPTKLYLVMDYCNGGELFYHLKTTGRFPEARARLYAAEITSALEHLHARNIVYRDLKPENVLLDSEGHVRVTDFGLAKDNMGAHDATKTFCGTPDYLAPEIIMDKGHGRGVDWWSLGTMIYEMLGGLPPYYSENVNVMYERVKKAPLEFKPRDKFSEHAMTLITGLLQKDPDVRMGSSERDAAELKEHPWFAPIDWDALYRREIKPAFVPKVANQFDTSNFDEEFTSQPIQESVMPDSALAPSKAAHFDGFTYVDKSVLGGSSGAPVD